MYCPKCPIGMPCWFGIPVTVIGAWFLLDDIGLVTTFDIDLLYLMTFIVPLGFVIKCCDWCTMCPTAGKKTTKKKK